MFYVLDDNHNLIEAYDKEGVLAVLEQAIADGSLSGITEDSGFISKLKCCVGGVTHHVAFVTQAKYNELQENDDLIEDCLYYITDDTTADDIDELLKTLTESVSDLEKNMADILDGGGKVVSATNADNADKVNNLEIKRDENGVLKIGEIVIPQKRRIKNGESVLEQKISYGSITINDEASTDLTDKVIEFSFEFVISIPDSVGGIPFEKSVSDSIKFRRKILSERNKTIRLGTYAINKASTGGGSAFDMGGYCLNIDCYIYGESSSVTLQYEVVKDGANSLPSATNYKFTITKISEVIE